LPEGFRRFAPSTCAIDAVWSTIASSGDSWKETGIRWGTNAGPSQLENGNGMFGVQKPGKPRPTNKYTAATEKIVADLAFVLELPVPPVTLWDRGENADPRYVSVSAWAFEQPFTWREIETFLTRDHLQQLIRPASAMLPFEEWVSASDRQNDGNVLVGFGPDNEALGAWIDYAWALDYIWQGNNRPNCRVRDMYPRVGNLDTHATKATADRIASVDSKTIEEIINRVSSDYLPTGVAESILRNLLLRQPAVHKLWT
jgi:hypothetical protein